MTLQIMHNAVVRTAMSCQEALALLDHIQPTVIITDISMPQFDGFSLLQSLRARSSTASLPIIALTANAMRRDRERILAAGFDGYISKPFDVATFGNTLAASLRKFANRTPQIPGKTAEMPTTEAAMKTSEILEVDRKSA